ncbi:MAG: hypothetical protein ABJE10_06915 [bacterium]
MARVNAAMSAAVLCLVSVQLACAQSASPYARAVSSELSISAGVAQSERRDLAASPLNFGGRGGDLLLGYARERGRTLLQLSLGGGLRTLASSTSAVASTERLTETELHAAALRHVDGRAGNADGLSIGASFDANVTFTAHSYRDASQRVSEFVLGVATLGPVANWKRTIGSGALSAQLGVPIAGFVQHSYSPLNAQYALTNSRLVTIGALRGSSGALSYASFNSARFSPVYLYRFAVMRYDDVQQVRALTQSLSVGMVARFGPQAQ